MLKLGHNFIKDYMRMPSVEAPDNLMRSPNIGGAMAPTATPANQAANSQAPMGAGYRTVSPQRFQLQGRAMGQAFARNPMLKRSAGLPEGAASDADSALGQLPWIAALLGIGPTAEAISKLPKNTLRADAYKSVLRKNLGLIEGKNLELSHWPIASHYDPVDGVVRAEFGTPAGILAHEAGHMRSGFDASRLSQPARKLGKWGLIGGVLGASFAPSDDMALASAAAGSSATLPTLLSELNASVKGSRMLKGVSGLGRAGRLTPFAGLPTYLAAAALPWLAYGSRATKRAQAPRPPVPGSKPSISPSAQVSRGDGSDGAVINDQTVPKLEDFAMRASPAFPQPMSQSQAGAYVPNSPLLSPTKAAVDAAILYKMAAINEELAGGAAGGALGGFLGFNRAKTLAPSLSQALLAGPQFRLDDVLNRLQSRTFGRPTKMHKTLLHPGLLAKVRNTLAGKKRLVTNSAKGVGAGIGAISGAALGAIVPGITREAVFRAKWPHPDEIGSAEGLGMSRFDPMASFKRGLNAAKGKNTPLKPEAVKTSAYAEEPLNYALAPLNHASEPLNRASEPLNHAPVGLKPGGGAQGLGGNQRGLGGNHAPVGLKPGGGVAKTAESGSSIEPRFHKRGATPLYFSALFPTLIGAGYGAGRYPGGATASGIARGAARGLGTGVGITGGLAAGELANQAFNVEHPLARLAMVLGGGATGGIAGNAVAKRVLNNMTGHPMRDRRYELSEAELGKVAASLDSIFRMARTGKRPGNTSRGLKYKVDREVESANQKGQDEKAPA